MKSVISIIVALMLASCATQSTTTTQAEIAAIEPAVSLAVNLYLTKKVAPANKASVESSLSEVANVAIAYATGDVPVTLTALQSYLVTHVTNNVYSYAAINLFIAELGVYRQYLTVGKTADLAIISTANGVQQGVVLAK